jgi:hypothetical protein
MLWRGRALRFAATGLMLALLGCGGSGTTTPPPGTIGGRPQTAAELRLEQKRAALTEQRRRLARTPQQRIELRRRFANALPPQACAALAQLGMPAGGSGPHGDKGASVALPYDFDAGTPYTSNEAGWIAHSDDVVIPSPGPEGGADLAPAGTDFPDNFSYIIYRIDDVTEAPKVLQRPRTRRIRSRRLQLGLWHAGALGTVVLRPG